MAPELVALLLGQQWHAVVTPLRILAVGLVFRVSCRIADGTAAASGAVYGAAFRQAVYAMAVIAGTLIGQHWGLRGVAVGVVIALAFNYVLVSRLALTVTAMPAAELLRAHAPGFAGAILVGLQLWLTRAFLIAEGYGAATVLILSLLGMGLTFPFICRLVLTLMPEPDVRWVLETAIRATPRPLRGIARGLLRLPAFELAATHSAPPAAGGTAYGTSGHEP
ncbi:MAG: hypothetical protein HC869_09115 [Rhodospirillales bacterium]|nr:hypothetical protein [Rhodospirillales bacterium]